MPTINSKAASGISVAAHTRHGNRALCGSIAVLVTAHDFFDSSVLVTAHDFFDSSVLYTA
jgi:hypothetical protein